MREREGGRLPIAAMADLVNAGERYRFTHTEFHQTFGHKVREVLNVDKAYHNEVLSKFNFKQICDIVIAYPFTDYTSETLF